MGNVGTERGAGGHMRKEIKRRKEKGERKIEKKAKKMGEEKGGKD